MTTPTPLSPAQRRRAGGSPMTTDFRAICAELVDALENARRIIEGADGTLHINTAEFVLRRARALLDQPEPAAPTDLELNAIWDEEAEYFALYAEAERFARAVLARFGHPTPQRESHAFAIVEKRLEHLADDQQLMIYRWPEAGEWDIHHTNPSMAVRLGEVNGKYGCTGRTLEEAVCGLAEELESQS